MWVGTAERRGGGRSAGEIGEVGSGFILFMVMMMRAFPRIEEFEGGVRLIFPRMRFFFFFKWVHHFRSSGLDRSTVAICQAVPV